MNALVRATARAFSAREIAARLSSASVIGNPDRPVHAIGSFSAIGAGILAFCDAANLAERLVETRAAVVIVAACAAALPRADQTLIEVADVRAAFIDSVEFLLPGSARPADPAPGAHPSAIIDDSATLAPSAAIGAGVSIGARTRIGPGAVIYADSVIGRDCVVGPAAIIGFVGLAYHDRADGTRMFFPHLGGVRIADRADIGAQTCICRGMLTHTVIGDDVKIGSLVYVSHGVIIGNRAWLSAGTAIAGHARIAADTRLGIGSVVIDNVNLEPDVRVGGGSVVTKDARAGERLYGVPAHPVPSMRGFGPTPRD